MCGVCVCVCVSIALLGVVLRSILTGQRPLMLRLESAGPTLLVCSLPLLMLNKQLENVVAT